VHFFKLSDPSSNTTSDPATY